MIAAQPKILIKVDEDQMLQAFQKEFPVERLLCDEVLSDSNADDTNEEHNAEMSFMVSLLANDPPDDVVSELKQYDSFYASKVLATGSSLQTSSELAEMYIEEQRQALVRKLEGVDERYKILAQQEKKEIEAQIQSLCRRLPSSSSFRPISVTRPTPPPISHIFETPPPRTFTNALPRVSRE